MLPYAFYLFWSLQVEILLYISMVRRYPLFLIMLFFALLTFSPHIRKFFPNNFPHELIKNFINLLFTFFFHLLFLLYYPKKIPALLIPIFAIFAFYFWGFCLFYFISLKFIPCLAKGGISCKKSLL